MGKKEGVWGAGGQRGVPSSPSLCSPPLPRLSPSPMEEEEKPRPPGGREDPAGPGEEGGRPGGGPPEPEGPLRPGQVLVVRTGGATGFGVFFWGERG